MSGKKRPEEREVAEPLSEFFVSANEHREIVRSLEEDSGDSSWLRRELELLGFWLADEQYAIDIEAIQEITKLPTITEVPRVSPSVLGIMSLRGRIVPVIDMRRVLRVDRRDLTRDARVVVLRGGGEPVGLLVDRVTSVLRLDQETLESPSTLSYHQSDLLAGIGRVNDAIVVVLDAESVVKSLETAL